MMKAKTWFLCWLLIVGALFAIAGFTVYRIDPFFHYHAPDTEKYFYKLNNQRSQNDGIVRHFDYDAVIIGTSMTENFKTSEMDNLFQCHSIKLPFSGAYYKETGDTIKKALKTHHPQIIVFALDMNKFEIPYDAIRTDQGEYPTYLFDDNPLNDVHYLLNRDVLFGRCYRMIADRKRGAEAGITSFDDYSAWRHDVALGLHAVSPDGITCVDNAEIEHLTDAEKEEIRKNITINLTDVADAYPDVDFYYYYTPYSAAWYNDQRNNGTLIKHLETERYVTSLLLEHENIRLFSFNNRYDITTDLNNYRDTTHYATWVNSMILQWLHDGTDQLTKENVEDYLQKEYDFYTTFDYESLNDQVDYESDEDAATLFEMELKGE